MVSAWVSSKTSLKSQPTGRGGVIDLAELGSDAITEASGFDSLVVD